MSVFEATIIINAPVDHVFKFLADLENATLWQFGVVKSVKLYKPATNNQSQFHQTVWMMGEVFERVCEIAMIDTFKEIAFKSTTSKVFDYEAKFRLEPMAPGTIVHFAGGIKLKGWRRFFRRDIELEAKDYIPTELERIKAALEARK